MRFLAYIFILVLTLILVRTSNAAEPKVPDRELAIWCEFMPYEEVQEALPLLARYNCGLLLHVERETLKDDSFLKLCGAAKQHGVNLTAWFLLPPEEHLYLGEGSIEEMISLTHAFLDWAEAQGHPFQRVVFDCEPSYMLGQQMLVQVKTKSPRGLSRLLKEQVDPARFTESARRIEEMVAGLQERGVEVQGTANRVFLDFVRFRNVTAQDVMNAPFTMIPWDRVSFITYRYKASRAAYRAMVSHYAKGAVAAFGDKATLDVGLLGDHRRIRAFRDRALGFGAEEFYLSFLAGMRDPQELAEAMGMGLDKGLRRFNLFSLDGAVASDAGLEAWLQAAATAPVRKHSGSTPLHGLKLRMSLRAQAFLFHLFAGHAKYDLPVLPEPETPSEE